MARHSVLKSYDSLKKAVKDGLYNDINTEILGEIYSECIRLLDSIKREPLISKVEGKSYFAFDNGKNISRAINKDLFEPDYSMWQLLSISMKNGDIRNIIQEDLSRIIYTMAISFCSCVDLLKDGDQKTPGTFFEYFIAYFFTWRIGVEPHKSIKILSIDEEDAMLPTDFIFNLGAKKRKFHMPIKTSSRERSIMLWAHQKLLDGVYGIERFMGTPVLLAETKTDKRKREVVEICLPDQWRVYQLYIAKLKRIYYLDLPAPYSNLSQEFPPLIVKPFADFFFEWDELIPD